ncbi:MAG TPA: hypothetical protein PLY01_07050, partial [Caldisericia bacterium]|nr:hypothetical protein [Caldisericia bacterium]
IWVVITVVVAVLVLLFIAFCVLCQKEVGISPCGAPENYIKWNLIDSKPFEEKPISYVDKAPFGSDRFLLTVSKDGTRMFGYEDITRKMPVWETELSGKYVDHSLFFTGGVLVLSVLSKMGDSNHLTCYDIPKKKILWETKTKSDVIISKQTIHEPSSDIEDRQLVLRGNGFIEAKLLYSGLDLGIMKVNNEYDIFPEFPLFVVNDGCKLRYYIIDQKDGIAKIFEKIASDPCLEPNKIESMNAENGPYEEYSYVFSDGKFLFSSSTFAHVRDFNVGSNFKLPVENVRPGFVEDMIFPYSDGICWIKDAQRKNDKAKFVKVIDGKGYEAITPLELNENSNDGHDAPEGFSYKSYLLKIGDRYKIVRVKEGVAGSVKFTVDNIQPFENGTEVYLIYYEDRDGALYFLTNRGTYSVRM